MNPPVSPQELREIAQHHNELSQMWRRVEDSRLQHDYDLSAQALEKWASDLERDADNERLENQRIREELAPHTDKG